MWIFHFMTEIVFNSFGWVVSFLRHCMRWQRYFHQSNPNGEIKLKPNDKPNELQQQKKMALKNEIVMCFRLRIDRVRAYISGIQADRFFLTNEWKKIRQFQCEWLLQLLYFICQISLQFVVHFCKKCIVSVYYQSPIEWLTFRQPIYVIFLNRKPVIDLLYLVHYFFIRFGHSLNTLQIRHLVALFVGCISNNFCCCRVQFDGI